MRRKDREVTDPVRIGEIIDACTCCRLGLADADGVYIVPMNFGCEERDGRRYLYFHSAPAGRKIELLRRSAQVGFEMDTGYRLIGGETACGYTAAFRSVIGTGSVVFLDDPEEKRRALRLLMLHTAGSADFDFPSAALDRVAVFRLEVKSLSCKEHL